MIVRFMAAAAVSAVLSVQSTSLWKDPLRLLMLGVERTAQADFREAIPLLETAAAADPSSALPRAWLANAYHLQRRLDEAAGHYNRLLQLEPAQPLSEAQREAVMLSLIHI